MRCLFLMLPRVLCIPLKNPYDSILHRGLVEDRGRVFSSWYFQPGAEYLAQAGAPQVFDEYMGKWMNGAWLCEACTGIVWQWATVTCSPLFSSPSFSWNLRGAAEPWGCPGLPSVSPASSGSKNGEECWLCLDWGRLYKFQKIDFSRPAWLGIKARQIFIESGPRWLDFLTLTIWPIDSTMNSFCFLIFATWAPFHTLASRFRHPCFFPGICNCK